MTSVGLWARCPHKDFSSAHQIRCVPNETPTPHQPWFLVRCRPAQTSTKILDIFSLGSARLTRTWAMPTSLMLVFLTSMPTSPRSHDSYPTQGASLRSLDSCLPPLLPPAALSLHICKKYLTETRNSRVLSAKQDFGLDEDTSVISSLCNTAPSDLLPT